MVILEDILEILLSVLEVFLEIGEEGSRFKRLSRRMRIVILCGIFLACLGIVGWMLWHGISAKDPAATGGAAVLGVLIVAVVCWKVKKSRE